ncbi:hypothetical protein CDD83_6290 [Cordyceps sp. RAO-2017]|nr:hypothetical protein CDD83_6290 [Cordyceps sp. RAO-2017]
MARYGTSAPLGLPGPVERPSSCEPSRQLFGGLDALPARQAASVVAGGKQAGRGSSSHAARLGLYGSSAPRRRRLCMQPNRGPPAPLAVMASRAYLSLAASVLCAHTLQPADCCTQTC